MPKNLLVKSKEKKRKRKLKSLKKDFEDPSKRIEKVTHGAGAKPKTKTKTKHRLKRKTLSKLIDGSDGLRKPRGTLKNDTNKLYTVKNLSELKNPTERRKRSDLTKDSDKKHRKRKHHRKEAKKSDDERSSKENNMAAGTKEHKERGRKTSHTNKPRKKPHSLPPLPRTPKSPVTGTPTIPYDGQNIRGFIGSPPPTALGKSAWRSTEDLRDIESRELTVYSPLRNKLQPRITLNTAPSSEYSNDDEPIYENAIVSASRSGRSSGDSLATLIRSASALTINSSLSIPPKLLSYVAEDGSPSVQEWVSENRSLSAISRRSSTPSIRDLPPPVTGMSPLEVQPKRSFHTKHSKVKLSPLLRR